MLEEAAQQSIAAARQAAPRLIRPPEYEPAVLSPEERAEADKSKNETVLCQFCASVHPLPSSPACPRLVSVELNADGKVTSATFRTDTKWQARVVLAEDLAESEDVDG